MCVRLARRGCWGRDRSTVQFQTSRTSSAIHLAIAQQLRLKVDRYHENVRRRHANAEEDHDVAGIVEHKADGGAQSTCLEAVKNQNQHGQECLWHTKSL